VEFDRVVFVHRKGKGGADTRVLLYVIFRRAVYRRARADIVGPVHTSPHAATEVVADMRLHRVDRILLKGVAAEKIVIIGEESHPGGVAKDEVIELEFGALDRQRRIGRYTAFGIGIARDQEIHPDRSVHVSPRLKILRARPACAHERNYAQRNSQARHNPARAVPRLLRLGGHLEDHAGEFCFGRAMRDGASYSVTIDGGYRLDASDGSVPGKPSRISFEKSGESLAARARVSIRLRVFSSAKGSPPVTMRWRSYMSSSPLPLSRMRQSHGRRSLGGCCVRMLVVQLVVIALYQRGLFRRALSEWMYSRKRSRACAGEMVVR